jgi:hypothetical protein
LLIFISNKKRKEVKSMKIKTSLLAALLLVGSLAGKAMAADDGILLKEEVAPGSGYCHMQFPKIDEDTLFSDNPVLKSPDAGNIVDYYGSCDENPLGKDQVANQRVWHLPNYDRYEVE